MPQQEIEACSSSGRSTGSDRRAPEGRRPVHLRTRRRGGPRPARPRESHSRSCPGSTAGVAAPAYAGIPVTQRALASAVAFVTGHEDPVKPARRSTGRRWQRSPARSSSTWACAGSPRSPAALIAAGRPPHEPVAVVKPGTLRGQRTVTGTLADDRRAGSRERTSGARRSRRRRGRPTRRGARVVHARPARRRASRSP